MIKKKNSSRFVAPSELSGEWSDCRGTFFWHEKYPIEMKHFMEKSTSIYLRRDQTEMAQLSYGGVTCCGGELQAVWLRLEAVIGARKLYSLIVKRTAPRKWVSRNRFFKSAKQDFTRWCAKLEVPSTDITWPQASAERLEQITRVSIVLEASALGEMAGPPLPATPSKEAVQAPRYDEVLFTTHKAVGMRLAFDGEAFVHANHDEQVMSCVCKFFEWIARNGSKPYRCMDGDGWKHIVHQLAARNE